MNLIGKAASIDERIYSVRGRQVMIDRDLAELYGVETKALNQAVKRNIERFPPSFMFRLKQEEFMELVTICDRFEKLKHSSNMPHAFTEQGVDTTIYTGKISKQLQLDIDRHNAQYPPIEVRTFSKAHDRFLIIDDEVYLIGASIKDLGKKWFGFTLMENTRAEDLIGRL